jgi:hypothetical protein
MDVELAPAQMNEFRTALLSAYPRREDLVSMVYKHLGVNLEQYIDYRSYIDTVFSFIEWARSRGKIGDLIKAAYQEAPGNKELQSIYESTLGNPQSELREGKNARLRLSESEQSRLTAELAGSVSSLAELERITFKAVGKPLREIIRVEEDLPDSIWNLIQWTEANGLTSEIIRTAQQWNPQNQAMSNFVKSLPKATREEERTIPGSAPQIPSSLRKTLIEALLLVPDIEDFEVRSRLLIGIPWRASLSRGISDVREDLETMVDQLGSLGQLQSGNWPLVILADNARAATSGREAENDLEKVYRKLLAFYQKVNDSAGGRSAR